MLESGCLKADFMLLKEFKKERDYALLFMQLYNGLRVIF